jgi:pimeloyl-ACP methyl ester carboxylesterase
MRVYRGLLQVFRIAVCGYLVILVGLCACQRQLLYRPDATIVPPTQLGLADAAVERTRTADGEDIMVWWIPPGAAKKPAFLYLHGNGGNLSYRSDRFARLAEDGSGVMAVSWRGYAGSTGKPTEQGLMLDARAAYALLRSRVEPSRIVLVGESLGTGIAVKLAAEAPVAALILDSGYSSILDVAAAKFPWLPVRWMLWDEYRADLAAPSVSVPVFQVHCIDDPVIPIEFGRRLNALFPRHAGLIEVPGRCHPVPARAFDAVLDRFKAGLPD